MRQLSLFNNDEFLLYSCITLDEIKAVHSQSFQWLTDHSKKIDLSSKPIFDLFISANGLTPQDCPQYYCSPYWGEACNNYKWRYIVISYNKTYFLVFLRIVGMFNQRHYSISYRILSSTGDEKDIRNVMDSLLELDAITEYEVVYNGDFETCDNANFYCDKNSILISKKRRKKLNRANKFFGEELEVRQISKDEKKSFQCNASKLYDTFQNVRFRFDVRGANKMLDIALNDSKCYVYASFFRGILVGIQIACNDFLNTCSIHFAKDISSFPVANISSYLGVQEDYAQKIRNFLGVFQEEYIKNDIIINKCYDALFVDGFINDSRKKMIAHKKAFYPKCIFYKITKV